MDLRTKPAYRTDGVHWRYSRNPHILKWWTPQHDGLIATRIEMEQWVWYWGIADEILKITPSETIEAWRAEDPKCSEYAWYNVLMYFAMSRARQLGLTKTIRKPQWKTCPLCNNQFVEDSLPYPFVKKIGIDQLDFCAPCLSATLFQTSGDETLSRQDVLGYLRDLADVLQRVPPQDFGEGAGDLQGLNPEERLAILKVLKNRPTTRRVKELFGSWLEALIEAQILEDGTRRTSRGTQCLAKDGHICLSLGEKTIDDFLYARGIPHEREPHYPEGNFRADFAVGGVFVEYFGLKGTAEYDAKARSKQRLCKKHGIKLISIYPSDLTSSKSLEANLIGALCPDSGLEDG